MQNSTFKILVHFIIDECRETPERLGAVKLNKILWFADTLTYQKFGKSATGETYVKRQRGPVPKTILATLTELKAEGRIKILEPVHDYDTRKFISMKPPDTSSLSNETREITRYLVRALRDHTAAEISDASHNEAWKAAAVGEEIPMYATLAVGKGSVTPEIKAWAESEIKRLSA